MSSKLYRNKHHHHYSFREKLSSRYPIDSPSFSHFSSSAGCSAWKDEYLHMILHPFSYSTSSSSFIPTVFSPRASASCAKLSTLWSAWYIDVPSFCRASIYAQSTANSPLIGPVRWFSPLTRASCASNHRLASWVRRVAAFRGVAALVEAPPTSKNGLCAEKRSQNRWSSDRNWVSVHFGEVPGRAQKDWNLRGNREASIPLPPLLYWRRLMGS